MNFGGLLLKGSSLKTWRDKSGWELKQDSERRSVTYPDIRICETYIECSYKYNIGIPKYKNTYDFLVQVRNLLLPLSLRVFRHQERDTIFLCWFFHQPQTTCSPATRSRRASKIQPSSSDSKTQLTDFSQISAHASGAWRHSHPWSYLLSGIFIVTSLNDTSAPRAREHLRSCLHLTHALSRKVLSLTNEIPRPLYYMPYPLQIKIICYRWWQIIFLN